MTTIYCTTNGEIVSAYTTSDGFPYIGDSTPSEWKHVVRLGDDSDPERAEIMATVILWRSLESQQIKETRWPVIEGQTAQQKEFKGRKISIIKAGNIVMACTLAKVTK